MKKIIAIILLSAISCSSVAANAEIHFDVEKVIWTDKYIYDTKNNLRLSNGDSYDWSKDDDIPTIEAMPEPNVIFTENGYISQINGEYYWSGRWFNMSPLPVVTLGDTIPSNWEKYISDREYEPDLFPYNANDMNIRYEVSVFGESASSYGLKYAGGNIGKWSFGWDHNNTTYIFVDGISSIKTNIPFKVSGRSVSTDSNSVDVMFWEDDTKFYIRNYNILLSTDKETFYATMDELEAAPKVKYQDTYLAFEQAPVIENDRTLIPIRFLFEQMGATVDWDGNTQTATITQDDTAITFAIDNTEADVNGQTVIMDVPAQLINGKTMVPVRFLSENLGYDVSWDAETRVITIE